MSHLVEFLHAYPAAVDPSSYSFTANAEVGDKVLVFISGWTDEAAPNYLGIRDSLGSSYMTVYELSFSSVNLSWANAYWADVTTPGSLAIFVDSAKFDNGFSAFLLRGYAAGYPMANGAEVVELSTSPNVTNIVTTQPCSIFTYWACENALDPVPTWIGSLTQLNYDAAHYDSAAYQMHVPAGSGYYGYTAAGDTSYSILMAIAFQELPEPLSGPLTNFDDTSDGSQGVGSDLGNELMTKDYLMSVYPHLLPWIKAPALWMCGYDGYGQLGDNYISNQSSPVQTIAGGTDWKQVSCGNGHTAAIKTDGTLWTWGDNYSGQLGDGTYGNGGVQKSSPIQTAAGGTDWKQAVAANYVTMAIKNNGTLWGWGSNSEGQLGDNSIVEQVVPEQIGADANWKQIACSYNTAVAIKYDGTLWTWGDNYYGQLGTGDTTNQSSPVQTIALGNNWSQASVGGGTSMAIKTDGTLWGIGYDSYGQLGDGYNNTSQSSPVQTIALGNNWKQVACGLGYTAAIKTDGTLWTWGKNNLGQLGNNTTVPESSPIQTIAAGTNWKSVACGGNFIAAVKTDGTLWTWGYGNQGQLAIGAYTNTSSPIQVLGGGNTWKSVSCGYAHIGAISESGKW